MRLEGRAKGEGGEGKWEVGKFEVGSGEVGKSNLGETGMQDNRVAMAPGGTLILARREIQELLSLDECIEAVESGFRKQSAGKRIPPGVLSAMAPGGAFHVKTAGLQLARFYFAAKLNGNFYDNGRFGLPRIQGLIVLCDADNGSPLAVMDSTEITVIRTGAATAVAAKYLARPEAAVATICGSGVQGRIQLRSLARVRSLKRVFVVDENPTAAEAFVDELSAELAIEMTVERELGSAARRSDLIVTCTPSKRALLGLEDVRAGSFVAAVGADSEEKQELAPELLAAAKVVVDHLDQCAQIGELHHAITRGVMSRQDVHAELPQVITGERPGRGSSDEIIVFDSTGVAHQDVATAALAYEKAVAAGVGEWRRLLA